MIAVVRQIRAIPIYMYSHVLLLIITWLQLQFLRGNHSHTWQEDAPTCTFLAGDDDVTTKMSHEKHYRLYLHFYKFHSNVNLHDGRRVYTDTNQHLIMTSLQIGHVANIYGFISTFISPLATKLGKMVKDIGLSTILI